MSSRQTGLRARMRTRICTRACKTRQFFRDFFRVFRLKSYMDDRPGLGGPFW